LRRLHFGQRSRITFTARSAWSTPDTARAAVFGDFQLGDEQSRCAQCFERRALVGGFVRAGSAFAFGVAGLICENRHGGESITFSLSQQIIPT
jgi:hypothetical protein